MVAFNFSFSGCPFLGVFTSVGGLGRNSVVVGGSLEIVLWSLVALWYVFPLAGEVV